MTYTIKLRRGTAGDWATVNPVLSEGEPGIEFETNYLKLGDGVTPWNDLEYTIGPGTGLPSAIGLPDNQMLVTLDGEWVIVDASGVLEGGAATIVTEYEATEGQDDFVLPSAPTPGTVRVYRNGLQQKSDHWILTDLTVTLATPCVVGEDIVIEQDGPVGTIYGIGPEGPAGPQGEQGETGDMGPPGVDGVDATRGPVGINAQVDTPYTLVLADATRFVTMTTPGACSIIVPDDADVDFPIGTQIEGAQMGAGQLTITPDSAVTLVSDPGNKVAAQYGVFGLLKIGANMWLVYGRLTA